jgi:DNA-binding response OmpR family regulator
MPAPSILIIEDEPDLRAGLQHNLAVDGFETAAAEDGREGLRLARECQFSMILLDLMLPEVGGLEVLQSLRDGGDRTPIIILSAKGQDLDKVRGLELGADDYVAKPFALAELTARIRAVLRRVHDDESIAQDVFEFPNLRVDFKRFTVNRSGEEQQLSSFEAKILRMLIAHRGEVVTRRDLLTRVWGYVHLPTTRTVDNHIARLRKKIEEDVENPRHVITVHGMGYRFDSEPTP